jgi:hypothetical protein
MLLFGNGPHDASSLCVYGAEAASDSWLAAGGDARWGGEGIFGVIDTSGTWAALAMTAFFEKPILAVDYVCITGLCSCLHNDLGGTDNSLSVLRSSRRGLRGG